MRLSTAVFATALLFPGLCAGAAPVPATVPAVAPAATPTNASARLKIGTVDQVLGTAQASASGALRPLRETAEVFLGDTVMAGQNGRVRLTLLDGVSIVVGTAGIVSLTESFTSPPPPAPPAATAPVHADPSEPAPPPPPRPIMRTTTAIHIAGVINVIAERRPDGSALPIRIQTHDGTLALEWGSLWLGPKDGTVHALMLSGVSHIEGSGGITLDKTAQAVALTAKGPEPKQWTLPELRWALSTVELP